VTNYRKMRRQARLARRSGLQPMMVINTGDAFPETVGVVLLRGAWRYRSELAPVGVVTGLVTAAWWLHHTRPHWWFPIAVLAGVAAWAVALFGGRWRLPTLPDITVAVSRSVTALRLSVAPDAMFRLHLVTSFRSRGSGGQRCEACGVVVPAGAGLVAAPPG
jgi:hypothetical protein